ncbi:MAG TPA: DUF4331 domain-containing protein [Polyangiaceae bacterium]|nr:DUF4331 domain-containing protein [Polyangiaceae bacterium]
MRIQSFMQSGLLGGLLAAGAIVLPASDAMASSHREAPFITKNPKVDGTDFYMFRSFETGRGAFVTVVANYIPLQNQYGGPNFFSLDPDALYEIHLDNTGDAKEDITFQFRFNNELGNNGDGTKIPVGGEMVAIPLVNSGPVAGGGATDSTNANLQETFSIKMVHGDRRSGTASDVKLASDASIKSFRKPLDYIGQKSFGAPAAYESYARKHIYEVKLDGCATNARVFVGQRRETFAVNLGVIFDLVNIDALGLSAVAQPLGDVLDAGKSNRAAFPNTISNANVTSIAMELPIECVTGSAKAGAAADAGKILGGWTTASMRQARVINPDPTFKQPTVEGGAWAQVSRLGFPLVNEAVIGLPDKDKFNSSLPKDDLANFATYVTNPTLPALLEILFGASGYAAPELPRDDLVAAAVTGVEGVNKPYNGGAGEMLRLNVAFTPRPLATQFPLGAAGCFLGTISASNPYGLDTGNDACDPNGFPNGRRPIDDVTDVVLAVAGTDFLRTPTADKAVLHDGVAQEVVFRTSGGAAAFAGAETFPYLPTPNGGT